MIRDITLTVRTITPLHIGTGRTLTKDFDFITKNGRTYRIREEGLIDELYARDPELTEQQWADIRRVDEQGGPLRGAPMLSWQSEYDRPELAEYLRIKHPQP